MTAKTIASSDEWASLERSNEKRPPAPRKRNGGAEGRYNSPFDSRKGVPGRRRCRRRYLTVYEIGADQSVSPVLMTDRYRNCSTVPGVCPVMAVLAWSVDARSIQVLPSVEDCQS